MDFNVSEVVEDAEFKELIQCLIDAFEEPPSKLLQLFIPSCPSDDAQATLAEAVERFSLWHRSDPTSTWIKVTDSETGKLLGAANWNIYDTNPYAEGSHSECYWWPEGPGRDAANALMHQLTTPRTMYMSKPHVCESRSRALH